MEREEYWSAIQDMSLVDVARTLTHELKIVVQRAASAERHGAVLLGDVTKILLCCHQLRRGQGWFWASRFNLSAILNIGFHCEVLKSELGRSTFLHRKYVLFANTMKNPSPSMPTPFHDSRSERFQPVEFLFLRRIERAFREFLQDVPTLIILPADMYWQIPITAAPSHRLRGGLGAASEQPEKAEAYQPGPTYTRATLLAPSQGSNVSEIQWDSSERTRTHRWNTVDPDMDSSYEWLKSTDVQGGTSPTLSNTANAHGPPLSLDGPLSNDRRRLFRLDQIAWRIWNTSLASYQDQRSFREHFAEALRAVEKQLARPETISNTTIAAVASFCTYESFCALESLDGSLGPVKAHWNGLQQLVDVRGGFRTAGFPSSLERLVARADLTAAYIVGRLPVIVPLDDSGTHCMTPIFSFETYQDEIGEAISQLFGLAGLEIQNVKSQQQRLTQASDVIDLSITSSNQPILEFFQMFASRTTEVTLGSLQLAQETPNDTTIAEGSNARNAATPARTLEGDSPWSERDGLPPPYELSPRVFFERRLVVSANTPAADSPCLEGDGPAPPFIRENGTSGGLSRAGQ
jgi:hypothetical protein